MNPIVKWAASKLPAIAIPHRHFTLSATPTGPDETSLRVQIPPIAFDKASRVTGDLTLYQALIAEGFFRPDQIPLVGKMIAQKIPLPRQFTLSAIPLERLPGQGAAVNVQFETPVNGNPFVRSKVFEVTELQLQQFTNVVEWIFEAQAMKDRSRGEG